MKLRTLSAFALAATLTFAALPATAQISDPMGIRLEAGFVSDFSVHSAGVKPEGDIRIGYDLPNGLTPMIGLGLRSHTNKMYDADDELMGSVGNTDIVLGLELRYYFEPHVRGLSPYVFGEFNTTIASKGTEDKDGKAVNELADKVYGDERSFMQLGAGLGLEYKFAKSFGIGGKWGLGLAFRNTSIQEVDGAKGGENTSNTTFASSQTLYGAFRF